MNKKPASVTRNVLITGAGVRVGSEIARTLAADGWNVAIHCHRSKAEAQKLAKELTTGHGVKAAVIAADLTRPAQLNRLVEDAVRAIGPITCLVNNASAFEKDAIETIDEASFQKHMAVNLFAPLALIRQFAAQLPDKAEGNVINIGDAMRGLSISPVFLSYSLSKLGLMEATPLLAATLAPRIRINNINPGHTLPSIYDTPGFLKRIQTETPLGHSSSPEEVCAAVRYILTSLSLTGQSINLGGGLGV